MDASHRRNVESKNQLQNSIPSVIFIRSLRTGKPGSGYVRQNNESPGKGGDGKGWEEASGVMEPFYILIYVVVTRVCVCVKIHRVHLRVRHTFVKILLLNLKKKIKKTYTRRDNIKSSTPQRGHYTGFVLIFK